MYNIEKIGTHSGLEYYVLAIESGHRCGYVKVKKDSIFYKKDYDDPLPIDKSVLNGEKIGKRNVISLFWWDGESVNMSILFNVHGGITYSGDSLFGESDEWYIGFDCAHAGDGKDESIMSERYKRAYKLHELHNDGQIRTTEYVEQECKNLIDQIVKFDN